MAALKLIPQLLAWLALVVILMRGFPTHRRLTLGSSLVGFCAGLAGVLVLFGNFPSTVPSAAVRSLLGGSFLVFWGVSVASLYRSTGRARLGESGKGFLARPLGAGAVSFFFALTSGAVCAFRLPGAGGESFPLLAPLLLALAACALVAAAVWCDRLLPPSITTTFPGTLAALVALCLLSSSFMLRLDLFSPLSMKVMKGTHDFVHQFMESILIPDHAFVRSEIWGYIGFLFGKEVGFWGGMLIWFIPVLLVLLAIRLEPLPQVSHIRQGAQRRKLIALSMRQRNLTQVVPAFALVLFAAAAYQSCYPTVEYWDPKPVPVTASAAGEILIPMKGEVSLKDGKLHKYLYRQGEREARFFVLLTPAGKLTVDLDACSICKPDGYGQTEGTVICYYCKTLIPLETVGRPGGCNPVPIDFSEKEDGVRINGISLINAWTSTVQATASKKEGGK
jgi:hypothetical protein